MARKALFAIWFALVLVWLGMWVFELATTGECATEYVAAAIACSAMAILTMREGR